MSGRPVSMGTDLSFSGSGSTAGWLVVETAGGGGEGGGGADSDPDPALKVDSIA